VGTVVIKVLSENASELPFTKHDQMVETFTPNSTDQSFSIGVIENVHFVGHKLADRIDSV
jgi:hypothetical protein